MKHSSPGRASTPISGLIPSVFSSTYSSKARKTAHGMGEAMNRKAYLSMLALSVFLLAFLGGCGGGSSSTKTPPPPAQPVISATSGSSQSATVGTAFAAPLVATVTTGGAPTSGVVVTFTAPSSGASGTFAGGGNTATATTNASGVATSAVFTANSTAGAYTVTATAPGATGTASFSLTNTAGVAASTTYVFSLNGTEVINTTASTAPNFYALAGAVTVDANGNVTAGEQDYNDGFGLTANNTITGGTLTVDPTTGQGTFVLITNNSSLGASGTETLGVQFVNTNHALIIEFDGAATSSGSLDYQTQPGTAVANGNYAFTLSGVDSVYLPVVYGGVFAISNSGTSLNGTYDENDSGNVTTANTISGGTVSAADTLGRGTITGLPFGTTFTYYIVGAETLRIIDMHPSISHVKSESAIGSAYGQGSGTFSATSLGNSVFGIASGNPFGSKNFAAAGKFITTPSAGPPATFSGIGDEDEVGTGVTSKKTISGTYSIAGNGYGSLSITSAGGLGSLTSFGLYATDPALNLLDPNNTATGTGNGALIIDLDPAVTGSGIVLPVTNASAGFVGSYAFGGQEYNNKALPGFGEFDFVGQGSVTAGAFSGVGLVSDPLDFFTTPPSGTDSGATFTGTITADGAHPGRSTLPMSITAGTGASVPFSLVIYQASADQLLWIDVDSTSTFLGSLQQQGSLSGLPAIKRKGRKNVR
jgi:hypothetical protein